MEKTVADIIDLARQIRKGVKALTPPLSYANAPSKMPSIQPIDELNSAYYFRFSAMDRPSVLSKIAGILGEHKISISSVIQKGREINGSVPIVMLTHEAREKNVRKAISLIDDLEVVTNKTIMIRVEGP